MTPDQSLREKVALKPCPFCGGDPLDRGFRAWECGSCGAKGPCGTKDHATAGWNRRAEPTPTERPDLAELRRLAVAAVAARGKFGPQIEAERTFHISANPAVVISLLDALAAAERDRDALQARLDEAEGLLSRLVNAVHVVNGEGGRRSWGGIGVEFVKAFDQTRTFLASKETNNG